MKQFSFSRVRQIMHLLFYQFKELSITMLGVYLLSILIFVQAYSGPGGAIVYWTSFMIFPFTLMLLSLLKRYITKYENSLQMIPASSGEKTVAVFGYGSLLYLVFPFIMTMLFLFLEQINGRNDIVKISMFDTFILLIPYGLVILTGGFYASLILRKRLTWIFLLSALVITTIALSILMTPNEQIKRIFFYTIGFGEEALNLIKWVTKSMLLLLSGYLALCCYNAFKIREQR